MQKTRYVRIQSFFPNVSRALASFARKGAALLHALTGPGVGPAPVLHPSDASANPQTAPVHAFHIGMWFDSTAEAVAAGALPLKHRSTAITPPASR
jgi:hypothetical protein